MNTLTPYTDYHIPLESLREEQTLFWKEHRYGIQGVNVIRVTDTREQTMEIRSLVSAKDSPAEWDLRVMLQEKLICFIPG